MKHAWLVALCLALAATRLQADVFDHPASGEALRGMLGAVAEELRDARTLRGSYRQEKQLAGLPRPLVAEGSFLFVRDRGIVWRTRVPFASELVITREALIQREGGNELRVDAQRQPAVGMIAGILEAVFSLDFAALEELFALHGERADGCWQLGLKPLQAAGTLETIELSGERSVRRVMLRETNGDLTRIELIDSRASNAAPDDADLAAFGS